MELISSLLTISDAVLMGLGFGYILIYLKSLYGWPTTPKFLVIVIAYVAAKVIFVDVPPWPQTREVLVALWKELL